MSNDLETIKKLAETYNQTLEELDLDIEDVFEETNGYALDENNNVFGLNLWNLGISDIAGIKELKHLTKLDVSSNQIYDISPLKELKHLTHLHLSANQISDISALSELKNLTDLRLYNNQITGISSLEESKNLITLNISSNQLSDISPLKGLNHLTTLHLNDNHLSDISSLEELKDLTLLNLNSNQLSDISPLKELKNLTHLYLSSNQLSDISGLKGLNHLTTLHLSDNQLPDISVLKELKGLTFLNLSGNQLADVSCLKELKKLFHLDLSSNQLSDIFDLKELKHLVQLDLGSNQISDVSGIHELKMLVRLYLMNNRISRLPAEILELGIEIKWESDVENGIFLKDNPLELPPVEIVKQGTEAVGNYFKEIKQGLHNNVPKAWLDVRDRLEAEEKDHISLDDYIEICKAHGLDEERAEFLSGYLHDLGVILHFRRDNLLKNTVFLDPGWAAQAVSTLMHTREIQENKGRFVCDDLKSFRDLNKYPENKHAELIRLMEILGLCFPHRPTGNYIIPKFLPPKKPPIHVKQYKKPNNLHFEYHYEFMPAGLVRRFISRIYYLIKKDHFWKNGVELEFEDSTALVIREPVNREMKVFISGPQKNYLQAIIRNEFLHIHKTLDLHKNKDYYEMLPCTCVTCLNTEEPHLYEYDALKKLVVKGIPVTHCPISEKDVGIEQLIKGFEIEIPKKYLLKVLVTTVSHLQGVAGTIKPDKDSRNGFIASILTIYRFKTKDRPWGHCLPKGKSLSRPDIEIQNAEGHREGAAETFILKNLEKDKINHHLTKIFEYKSGRRETLFIIVYAETDDFPGLWEQYLDHLPGIDFLYPLTGSLKEEKTNFTGIKLARTTHIKKEKEIFLYHLFINMKH